MSVREEQRVVKASSGGWEVTAPAAKRASSLHSRQAQAVERAVAIVEQAGGGTVVVHNRSGEIVETVPVEPNCGSDAA